MKRFLSCERGTSAVELAVSTPLFLLLMVGTIDMARYAYYSILAAHAARAGVQYAAQNLQTAYDAANNGPNTAAAATHDAQNLSNWKVTSSVICFNGGQLTACPSSSTVPATLLYYVSVKVTGTFNGFLSYPGIGQQVPVTGSAMMRVDTQ